MSEQPKPSFASFARAMSWSINRYFLARAGVTRHQVRLHVPRQGGFYVEQHGDYEFRGRNFIQRGISFANIGILCSSNTGPCLKELVLSAEIPESSPLYFGENHKLRDGFEPEPTFGFGKSYRFRIDYTQVLNEAVQSSELLKLESGTVHYPFRFCGSGIYHRALAETHRDALAGSPVPMRTFSDSEQQAISTAFDDIRAGMDLNVALILDNDDILAFHWNPSDEVFDADYFNFGAV